MDEAKFPQQLIFENVSPATRLLEKRRQMYEVQDALDNQKAQFAKEEERFKKKEDQLRQRDACLQDQLIKFNKFLQDNEAKRRRAETRAAEEGAQIKQREEEISALELESETCKNQCAGLEEEVKRNMKYEEFLEKVKDTCDDYSEIQDLISRYETLDAANSDLRINQEKFDVKNEELRSDFQNYKKEKQLKILSFTTQTAELQNELEEAEKERNMLEQQVDQLTQQESESSLYLGQVLNLVENLFQRCVEKRPAIQHRNELDGIAPTKTEEEGVDHVVYQQQQTIKQLRVISAYLKDFREITEVIKKERRPKMAEVVENLEPHAELVVTTNPTKLFEGSNKLSRNY